MDNPNTHNFYPHHLKIKKLTKVQKKPTKVRYISSPLIVRANNATEFRAIVEELTGQNSDLGRFEDASTAFVNEASSVLEHEISTTNTAFSDNKASYVFNHEIPTTKTAFSDNKATPMLDHGIPTFSTAKAAFSDNKARPIIDHGISTTKTAFSNGEFDVSNMMQPLEFDESSFWREVSTSFGFQFSRVLV